MRFEGKLFRALNPIYADEPLTGRGAEFYGGRFNPKGMPALYTSVSIMTCIREANQAGTLQPTTLVSYEAVLANVFDARDQKALETYGMDADALADPAWRDEMKRRGKSRTQVFAERLVSDGFQGILVRSYAPGATEHHLNLVLWSWGTTDAQLDVIDDEARLGVLGDTRST